jgi:hypothetical protein
MKPLTPEFYCFTTRLFDFYPYVFVHFPRLFPLLEIKRLDLPPLLKMLYIGGITKSLKTMNFTITSSNTVCQYFFQ